MFDISSQEQFSYILQIFIVFTFGNYTKNKTELVSSIFLSAVLEVGFGMGFRDKKTK